MKIPRLTDVNSHNPLQDSLNVSKRTPTPVDPLNFCLCHMGFAAVLLLSENSKGVESTLERKSGYFSTLKWQFSDQPAGRSLA